MVYYGDRVQMKMRDKEGLAGIEWLVKWLMESYHALREREKGELA